MSRSPAAILDIASSLIERLDESDHFATPHDAWRWLKMPGMDRVPPQAPRPLVNVCGCGRQISNRRVWCHRCYTAELMRLAAQITSRQDLDVLLSECNAQNRADVLEVMGPYLKVKEAVNAMDRPPAEVPLEQGIAAHEGSEVQNAG